jgi:hypothetical protein
MFRNDCHLLSDCDITTFSNQTIEINGGVRKLLKEVGAKLSVFSSFL